MQVSLGILPAIDWFLCKVVVQVFSEIHKWIAVQGSKKFFLNSTI
jgi:hypothetical protein